MMPSFAVQANENANKKELAEASSFLLYLLAF